MGRCSDAKQKLLDAALKLFWERSYYSVSVDNICAEAGVKKGSFYHFFKSKNELAADAIEFHWKNESMHTCNTFSSSKPPLERIKDYLDMGYQHQKALKDKTGFASGCPYFDLGAESASMEKDISDRITSIINEMKELLSSTLKEAMEDGSIENGDPVLIAEWLYSLMGGALTYARIYNDPEVLKDIYKGAFRLIGVK
jgi:TetR/AcrR family transcriptional repressor of nem operon